jgi:hypothetical protein
MARNNIVNNNINVTLALHNTKLDKGKVFDKIIVSMVKNYIEEVLSTDNVTRPNHHEKVLTFNPSDIEFEPHFNQEELNLLDVIYRVI